MEPKVPDGQVQYKDRRQKSAEPGAGSAMEMSGQERLKIDKLKHMEGEPSEQGAYERRTAGDDLNSSALIPTNSKQNHQSRCAELVVLDLSQNCMTHAGAACLFQALRHNQTLVQLSLGNSDARHKNNVGARGARHLRELLQINQSLSILDLKGNALCDQGMFQLCQGLRHNTGLTHLNISQNGFSAFGVEFLKDALIANAKNGLQELDISYNNVEAHGVSHLSTFIQHESCRLKSLNVEGCGIQGQHSLNFFKGLKKCQTLRQLKAEKNDFSHPVLRRALTAALGSSL